jgi:hypothetical protein
MKRDRSVDSGLAYEIPPPALLADASAGATDDDAPPDALTHIGHDRARELILEQTRRLLPPSEANALADHLVECDRCFRFAQDVAELERKRHSGELRR